MAVVLTVAVAVVVVVWLRDDGSKAADEAFAGATVEVSLRDYSIAGALTDVPAGPVRLHVVNEGGAVHNVGLRGGPITTDLQPGRTTTLDLGTLSPGTYELYCDVSDHVELGMVTPLLVVEPSDTIARGSIPNAG